METRQDSEDFYEKLLAFDDDLEKAANMNYVKELLYKFSYCNLENVFTNPMLIRKSVINYLYTGKFRLTESNDITEQAKQCLSKILEYEDYELLNELEQKLGIVKQELEACTNATKKIKISKGIQNIESKITAVKLRLGKKVDFEKFYKIVHINWVQIHQLHEELISKFVDPKNIKEVKYLIIYEAPPYSDTSEKYFLQSNRGTYGNPIKECFSKSNSESSIAETLFDNNAIYFDLIMAGIPIKDAEMTIDSITRPIRYFWSTNPAWKIGEKQLPVILLELGVFHLFNKEVKFDKRPFIAIGTPLNTSASIFEYYSKNYLMVYSNELYFEKEPKNVTHIDFENVVFKVDSKCTQEYLIANLSLVNTPSTYEIRGTSGETYPLFKSNFIGSSNFPNGSLLKNAFNII